MTNTETLSLIHPCFRCGSHEVTRVDTFDEGFIGTECVGCQLYATIDASDIATRCPGCDQAITVTDTTECGGEGEGICCVMADDDEPCEFHPDGHDPLVVAASHAAHLAAFTATR